MEDFTTVRRKIRYSSKHRFSHHHQRLTAFEVPVLLCSRFAEHRQDHRRANNYRRRLRVAADEKRRRKERKSLSLSFCPPSIAQRARVCIRSRWHTEQRFFSRERRESNATDIFLFFFPSRPIISSSFARWDRAASHPPRGSPQRI